jgi:DNA-binding IclR family transcriptional regulator
VTEKIRIKESQRHVEVLLKGLEVLDCVEQHQPISLSKLAEDLNINKSRAIRLCGTLEHGGYLMRDSSKKYSLGHRVLSLGHAYEKKSPIVYIIRPFLENLSRRSSLAAAFYVLAGQSVVCLVRIGGGYHLNPDVLDSNTKELHFGASGKVFLAFGDPALRDRYFSSGGSRYPRLTPNTITSPEVLWEKLKRIKEDGYCVSLEERVIGAGGIGAPVFKKQGEFAGVVTMSGDAGRFTGDNLDRLIPLILETAENISKNLVY